MIAVPLATGVHWNTCSGALALAGAQLPLCALDPDVVPPSVPPCAGTTRGLPHVPLAGAVVELVDDVVLVEVVDEVVDGGAVVLDVVLVEVVDEVVGGGAVVLDVVLVVVVLVVPGGMTVSANVPLAPP